MLDVLSDPIIKSAASLFVIPLLVMLLLLATILFLRALLTPRPDTLEAERLKLERYEAGNPPKREPGKGKVSMQYLGYLIIFLAVEPALVLFALALASPKTLSGGLLKLYAVFAAVYTPLLYYALRESRVYRKWIIE